MLRSSGGHAGSVLLRRPRVVRDDELVLGQCEGWVLTENFRQTWKDDWWSLKLYRTVASPKSVYWLAYNLVEKRFARGSEYAKLEKYHPLIADWVWLMVRKQRMPLGAGRSV